MSARRTFFWRTAVAAILAALWVGAAMPAWPQAPAASTRDVAAQTASPEPAVEGPPAAPHPALVALAAGGVVVLAFVVLTLTGAFSPHPRRRDGKVGGGMNKS